MLTTRTPTTRRSFPPDPVERLSAKVTPDGVQSAWHACWGRAYGSACQTWNDSQESQSPNQWTLYLDEQPASIRAGATDFHYTQERLDAIPPLDYIGLDVTDMSGNLAAAGSDDCLGQGTGLGSGYSTNLTPEQIEYFDVEDDAPQDGLHEETELGTRAPLLQADELYYLYHKFNRHLLNGGVVEVNSYRSGPLLSCGLITVDYELLGKLHYQPWPAPP
jgi:hypothetical protein